jgi:hypothetical protein
MSLRHDAAMGLFAHRIAYLDRPTPAPDDTAIAIATEAARLVLTHRAPATRRTVPRGLRDLLFVVCVVGQYDRRDCLASGAVICAAIHAAEGRDHDSPVRRADRDAARIARWLAPHVGFRTCVAARQVGRGHVRLVIVGVDRQITVVRVPIAALPERAS